MAGTFGIKVILKGGLTMLGIILMAIASIGDITSGTPDKFQTLFYIGVASTILGVTFILFLGQD